MFFLIVVECEAQEQRKIRKLIEQLGDADSWVRDNATKSLVEIGTRVEEVVPALIKALKVQNSEVRGNAASALGEIGEPSKEAVPALVQALKDPELVVFFLRFLLFPW